LLFPGQAPGYELSWSAIIVATAVSAGFLMLALTAVWRAHRRTVVTGDTLLIGRPAQVLHWDKGEGEVQVSGERWRATSAAPLSPGQHVRVVERRNLTLSVEPEASVSQKP
jgi:membrane-bound serine protease (ClpP class)